LLARVEAILRRARPRTKQNLPPQATALQVGALVVGPVRRRALLGDEQLALTPTEFRLITVLSAHAEAVLSRDQLAHQLWGYSDASNSRTIDVHIRRLRAKLARSRVCGPAILSVRGTGYRITAEESAMTAA
jgi:DNA-binding response OmpR family regulator